MAAESKTARWLVLFFVPLLAFPVLAKTVLKPPPPVTDYHTEIVKSNDHTTETVLTFTSPKPSGEPANDRVRATVFQTAAKGPTPAVIVLHGLKMGRTPLEERLCRELNRRGITALLMELPYHMSRTPPGMKSGEVFTSGEFRDTSKALEQAIADVSACADWLADQPNIDGSKLGIVGISLGAIVGLSASQHVPRIAACVSLLGSGDLPYIYKRGWITAAKYIQVRKRGVTTETMKNWLGDIDPLYCAGKNPNCKVYMIAARHDPIIPPAATKRTWVAFGRPPITWLNSGHHSAFLAVTKMFAAAGKFFECTFGLVDQEFKAPTIRCPHLRVGFMRDDDWNISPSMILGLYPVDKNGWVVCDLGVWIQGTFAGVSLHPWKRISVGYGYPLTGKLDNGFIYADTSVIF